MGRALAATQFEMCAEIAREGIGGGEAVGELERRTGKPVVSSNQASIWATFRALKLTPTVTGYGRLLASLV